MRINLMAIALLLGSVTAAEAQETPRADLALAYHAVRTNTTPGVCGCFLVNGGDVSSTWNLGHGWSAVALASEESSNKVLSTGQALTIFSVLAGTRYWIPQHWQGHHAPQPFAEVLVGGVHAQGLIAGSGAGTTSFGARVGGGIEIPVNRHFAVRALQVAYFLTDVANSSNNRQNNLLVGAGIAFRWPDPAKHPL